MDSWVIKDQQGRYMAQDTNDRIRWVDAPAPFGGEKGVVERYYSDLLAAGCTLERYTVQSAGESKPTWRDR